MRKFLPALLALTLAFSLVACGNNNTTETPDSNGASGNSVIPHPFAIALTDFFETVPGDIEGLGNFENAVISHTSAYLIDIDGNGTQGVIAYKAYGEVDCIAIFYMLNGELRTLFSSAGMFFYLGEFGESPLVTLGGGEGAGRIYTIYSLTENGLVATSTLWATVGDEFYYNDSLVTRDEFSELLEKYGLNNDRWLVIDRKPHTISNFGVRAEAVAPRPDDTVTILSMTIPTE